MWCERLVSTMRNALGRFATGVRGSVSVDFVVAIPILLAVLAFTSEYGRLLQLRTTLDNAVGDATRYLARAPTVDPDDNSNTVFSAAVIEQAEALIRRRINVDEIVIGAPSWSTAETGGKIDDYRIISLSVGVGLRSPALSVMSIANRDLSIGDLKLNEIEGFILVASESARYFGR